MKIKLASDLEKALLRAIAEGVCPPEAVVSEELSKKARVVYEAIIYLLKKRVSPPLRPASILLTAQSLFGVDQEEFKSYLSSFKDLETGSEVSAILRAARDKAALVALINESGQQLAKGHLDVSSLSRHLDRAVYAAESIHSLSSSIKDKFPTPPKGIPIRSLPIISEASNGLIGVWIIGGEPGLGKSTLGYQIALDASREIPAIYYDLDGTGREYLIERSRLISLNSVSTFRKLTKHFYLRENIASLDDDIASLRVRYPESHILIVIDSLQTLPTSLKYHKESLDGWIKRFKDMTKKRLVFLCVSEQNRAFYGEAKMSGYKGSGDIEYAGSLCVQLIQEEDADESDPVQFHIVKNRHGKRKGHVADLERDTKRIFWFTEEEPSNV